MLSPRHGFQSLLLHLVLAVRTHAVLFLLNAFQRRFDHVQNGPVSVGHAKQEFLGIGIRRFVGQIHRGIFVSQSAFFGGARDGLQQLIATRQ